MDSLRRPVFIRTKGGLIGQESFYLSSTANGLSINLNHENIEPALDMVVVVLVHRYACFSRNFSLNENCLQLTSFKEIKMQAYQ